jgi:hypothetical protein
MLSVLPAIAWRIGAAVGDPAVGTITGRPLPARDASDPLTRIDATLGVQQAFFTG